MKLHHLVRGSGKPKLDGGGQAFLTGEGRGGSKEGAQRKGRMCAHAHTQLQNEGRHSSGTGPLT